MSRRTPSRLPAQALGGVLGSVLGSVLGPASGRALGLLLGYAADRAVGDPGRLHPVAGFGALAVRLERLTYRDSRRAGAAHELLLVGAAVGLGVLAERAARGPVARTAVTAVATWTVLGERSLAREATAVHALLAADDLAGARLRVQRLVGRDTEQLTASQIARAVVESVAENTSDAVVAPLLWGALAGPAGLLGYRAVNTLDAMVGHHNDRYERFGWAAARLDDLVNLPAARLSGLLVLATSPRQAGAAWAAWRRDAVRHPSPNAGVLEATFAGALGIRLGGTNQYYGNRVEERALMGDGPAAAPRDIAAAVAIASRVGLGAVGVGVVLTRVIGGRR